jgi:DNA-binding NarL/FixJ family response regulator
MTKILLADDHRLLREGFRMLLEADPTMQVVGEAENGRAAVQLAAELSPDVVLMDVRMPDMDGIEATRQIRAMSCDVKVIALGASIDERTALELRRAGASGVLSKVNAFDEVVGAVRAVASGAVYFSPTISGDIAENIGRRGTRFSTLSPRERETLTLIAEGLATKQIARQLHVSVKTIETHRRNLMEKLNLDSVADLTRCAIREGLATLEADTSQLQPASS